MVRCWRRIFVLFWIALSSVANAFLIPSAPNHHKKVKNTWLLNENENDYEEQNPSDFQKHPSITRIYTNENGESQFETIHLDLKPFSDREGSHGLATELLQCQGILFRTSPPGYSLEWHCAPRRQFIIQLTGTTEIQVGDGPTQCLGPGEVLLAEDLTGRGHCTRVIGTEPRFYAVIPLTE